MIFWLLAALMTGLVIVVLLPPLTGRKEGSRSARPADLSIYEEQLAELARDRERGVVGPEEATGLQAEIERRMLAAAEAARANQEGAGASWRLGPVASVVVAALLPAGAAALYFVLGEPGLPSQPRLPIRAEERPTSAEDAEVARLAEELATRMAERPGDPVGWRLLGRAEAGRGRWAESAQAYARAVAVGGEDAETLAAWGEALIFASGGQVTPPAEEVLRRAVAADPKEPRARYYQGLARFQAGAPQQALAVWRALLAEAPPDAPWASFIAERIRLIEPMAPQPEVAPGAPAPGPEEIAAADAMAPEERDAFIRGMVQRLADRLAAQPEDLEGWLRLAQAYGVLGQGPERRQALERAAQLAPDRADVQLALAEADAEGGAAEAAMRRLELLLAGLSAEAPERGRAQALLNRLRDRE